MGRERRPSSIALSTAGLLLDRIFAELQLPPLQGVERAKYAELLHDWCRVQSTRAIAAEQRVTDEEREAREQAERRADDAERRARAIAAEFAEYRRQTER